jgi:hypothetical protein
MSTASRDNFRVLRAPRLPGIGTPLLVTTATEGSNGECVAELFLTAVGPGSTQLRIQERVNFHCNDLPVEWRTSIDQVHSEMIERAAGHLISKAMELPDNERLRFPWQDFAFNSVDRHHLVRLWLGGDDSAHALISDLGGSLTSCEPLRLFARSLRGVKPLVFEPLTQ